GGGGRGRSASGPRERRPRRWCRSRPGRETVRFPKDGAGGSWPGLHDAVQEGGGHLRLGHRREVLAGAVGAEERDAGGAGAEAGAGLARGVEDDPVEVLLRELGAGVRLAVVRLQREADERLARPLLRAEAGEQGGRAAAAEDGLPDGLLGPPGGAPGRPAVRARRSRRP